MSKRYVVFSRQICGDTIYVDADSEQEAIDIAYDGGGWSRDDEQKYLIKKASKKIWYAEEDTAEVEEDDE